MESPCRLRHSHRRWLRASHLRTSREIRCEGTSPTAQGPHQPNTSLRRPYMLVHHDVTVRHPLQCASVLLSC